MPNTVQFKALVGFSKLSDLDVVKNGISVQNNLTGNSKFANAPVDLAVLKTDLDSLTALIAEAADGSKKVIARKNQQREVVIGMLRMLARYVEVASQGDPAGSRRADSSGLQRRGRNRRHCPRRSAKSIAAPIVGKFSYGSRLFVRPAAMNSTMGRPSTAAHPLPGQRKLF